MASDEHFARNQRPAHDPTQQQYRCVECGGRFPAAQVYDDEGEVICEDCYQETAQEETGVEVRASTFVLSLFALLATPCVVIDDREYPLSWWSSRFFPLRPGRHRVRVYVNHMFGTVGSQSVEVRIRANRLRKIDYSYWLWWLPTSLNVR